MGGHHHHNSSKSSTKILATSIVLTFSFSLIELFGGIHANSLALISDAGHMGLDSFALIIAFLAAKITQRPPSQKHSYGLGRAEVITAVISCTSMLVIAILITLSALKRYQNPPHHIQSVTVMIIAGIGLIINVSIAYLLSSGKKSINIRAALLHVLGDILGSIAALASGLVIYLTGWAPIDAILSLLIAILIGASSVHMLKQALHILMEGVPHHLNLQEIKEDLIENCGIIAIHDLHIWNISSELTALSAHVHVESLQNWNTVYYTIQSRLADRYHINHVTLQPEITTEHCSHCVPNE
jgi:cobalt-zinc-cadmium efflux system protein